MAEVMAQFSQYKSMQYDSITLLKNARDSKQAKLYVQMKQ